MKKYFLGLLCSFLGVFAQLDQYSVYTGVVRFSKDEALNIAGEDQNGFAGFKTNVISGVGFSMFASDHVRFGLNLEGFSTSKKNFEMSLFSINPSFNFHLVSFDKRISPFVGINASASFLNLSRSPYVYTTRPSTQYSVLSATNVAIVSEEISRPYFKLQYQPIFGGGLSAGFDIKLSKHFGLMLAANYNRLFEWTNPILKKNFNNNKYDLYYLNGTFALRYRIF
jgi:outer membrane protein W